MSFPSLEECIVEIRSRATHVEGEYYVWTLDLDDFPPEHCEGILFHGNQWLALLENDQCEEGIIKKQYDFALATITTRRRDYGNFNSSISMNELLDMIILGMFTHEIEGTFYPSYLQKVRMFKPPKSAVKRF